MALAAYNNRLSVETNFLFLNIYHSFYYLSFDKIMWFYIFILFPFLLYFDLSFRIKFCFMVSAMRNVRNSVRCFFNTPTNQFCAKNYIRHCVRERRKAKTGLLFRKMPKSYSWILNCQCNCYCHGNSITHCVNVWRRLVAFQLSSFYCLLFLAMFYRVLCFCYWSMEDSIKLSWRLVATPRLHYGL